MKILLCHTYYQLRGGEDQSFESEARMLQERGHEVLRYTLHNGAMAGMGRLEAAGRTLWNRQAYRDLRALVRQERPQIMHCTNTFPLMSPAVFYAARAEGLSVVHSLRNYRLLCPASYFLRDGRVCEDCLGKIVTWPAVRHRCYRQSRAASAVVAAMLSLHRVLGTWKRSVSLFFTPTEFARRKLIEGGFSPDRIAVKPNFVDPDPGPGSGRGGYAVFVGRLSPEKGVAALLAAWDQLGARLPLKIVGDGPLVEQVQAAGQRNPAIQWLGQRPLAETLAIVGEATCLIMPSVWYETFGRTIVEAFAKGTPVIASRMGTMTELIDHGRTGLLFQPGDAHDLTASVEQLLSNPTAQNDMRQAVRQEYLAKYTAEPNYAMLMAIYQRALELDGQAADRL